MVSTRRLNGATMRAPAVGPTSQEATCTEARVCPRAPPPASTASASAQTHELERQMLDLGALTTRESDKMLQEHRGSESPGEHSPTPGTWPSAEPSPPTPPAQPRGKNSEGPRVQAGVASGAEPAKKDKSPELTTCLRKRPRGVSAEDGADRALLPRRTGDTGEARGHPTQA